MFYILLRVVVTMGTYNFQNSRSDHFSVCKIYIKNQNKIKYTSKCTSYTNIIFNKELTFVYTLNLVDRIVINTYIFLKFKEIVLTSP